MADFDGEMYDGDGRMTLAYATYLRQREEAVRLAKEKADYEKSDAGMRAQARRLADEMDMWSGNTPYRDEIDLALEAVRAREAAEKEEGQS